MPTKPTIWRRLAQNYVSGLLLSAALLLGCDAESHPEDAGPAPAADSGEAQSGSSGKEDRDTGAGHETTGAHSCKANVPEAASGCHSAPSYVKCDYGQGLAFCLSENPSQCEAIDSTRNCRDQCADDEYAVACGGVGPNAPPFSEPPGCRGFGRNPGGGSEAFCCPCPAP